MDFPKHSPNYTSRFTAGVLLAVIGFAALVVGGPLFTFHCALVGGIMFWEIVRLTDSTVPNLLASALGILAAATVCVASLVNTVEFPLTALLFVAPLTGTLVVSAGKLRFFAVTLLVLLAAHILDRTRFELGFLMVLWIVVTVVASDVFGYYAGRKLRGPKLAPSISPHKTWSGAVAGWIGAAGIGYAFSDEIAYATAILGVWIAIWAQVGDLGESVFKRAAGVKDTSTLLAGHGGFCDRFDSMAGGSHGFFLIYAANEIASNGTISLP